MDFQLTAYLGILYASHPDDRFIIMSRDEGFDSAILFLRDLGADVRCFPPPVHPVVPAPVLSRTYAEATRPMVSAVTIPVDESLLDETPVEQAADIGPLPAPPSAEGAGQAPVSQDDFPAAQDGVPQGIPDTVGGLLPGDIEVASAVQPTRKSEVQQFIDTLSRYNQGVAGYYQTSLLRLGVTDEHELAEAVAILYDAMKAPPNTRRATAYSAFRRRYGIKDGQARYRPIKDFVGKISASGPVPKQDAGLIQDQHSIPADNEAREPVLDGEDDLRETVSATRTTVPPLRNSPSLPPGGGS